MPPVEQDALIYGPIRVELLTHKVLAQGKFVHFGKNGISPSLLPDPARGSSTFAPGNIN